VNPKTRFVLIGLALIAALYVLWPTWHFHSMDSERSALDSAGQVRWDSLHREEYLAARNKRIKLGLDLQGGIYITMEVDAPGMLYESAQRDAIDDTFEQVIAATREEAKLSDEKVIDIFTRNFDKIARPKGRTLLNYFDVGNLGSDASDETITKKLAKNIEDAVDQAVTVVRQRIDKYGVAEPTIQKVGGRRIVVELPGVSDENEVRGLLQTTARLEFKLVKNNVDGARLFKRIDEILAGKIPADTVATKKGDSTVAKVDSTKVDSTKNVAKKDSTKVDTTRNIAKKDSTKVDTTKKLAGDTANGKKDSNLAGNKADTAAGDTNDPYKGLSDEEKGKRYRADHPFSSLFLTSFSKDKDSRPQDVTGIYMSKPSEFPTGEYYFYVPKNAIPKIQAMLARPEIRSIFPEDLIVAFDHATNMVDPDNAENSLYQRYIINRDPELTGDVVTDAAPDFDPQTGQPMVRMQMNADGASRWSTITGQNIGKRVAIVLDSAVYSAPTVQNKIPGGSSQITGSKDAKEANLLAVVLKAGALKAPVKIIEERIVGPSLGEDSIKKGVTATLGAALLVMLFMAIYYAAGGAIADVAVIFNVLLTLAVLAALGATLTLPGIGGLVLTIGMAVDANILIYERMREEMAAGKSLKTAVQLGYEKAWTAIIDTHITTFMTGAILYFFGTGPIQGFALTLMIGLAATLFTAVFVTRTVFAWMLERGATSINIGQPKLVAQRA
jgi:protein-export membrane protein SecD